jgi:DoxX-like family
MNDRSRKIAFRIATGLLSVIALMFVGNSLFNAEMFTNRFASLGYPTYLIYPLAVAKILGLVAIWSNKSKTLKEWAYAGFFFNFVLAFLAELHAPDGEYISAPLALVLLMISYYSGHKEKN